MRCRVLLPQYLLVDHHKPSDAFKLPRFLHVKIVKSITISFCHHALWYIHEINVGLQRDTSGATAIIINKATRTDRLDAAPIFFPRSRIIKTGWSIHPHSVGFHLPLSEFETFIQTKNAWVGWIIW